MKTFNNKSSPSCPSLPCVGSFQVLFEQQSGEVGTFGINLNKTSQSDRYLWTFTSYGTFNGTQKEYTMTLDLSQTEWLKGFKGPVLGFVNYDQGMLLNAKQSITYTYDQKHKQLSIHLKPPTLTPRYEFSISIEDSLTNCVVKYGCSCCTTSCGGSTCKPTSKNRNKLKKCRENIITCIPR